MCPVPKTDGHDAPGLVGELVPGLAAVGEDVVVAAEDPVGEPVLAQELPDVLHRVQLGRTGRERQEGDVRGHLEAPRHVPAGLVEDQDGMCIRVDRGADLGEVSLHRVRVGEGHHQRRALSELRADRAEEVGPFRALVVRCSGPGAAPCPAAGDQVLLADTGFVLEPDLDPLAAGVALADRFHDRGEVFLNSSMASGS